MINFKINFMKVVKTKLSIKLEKTKKKKKKSVKYV